MCNEEDFTSSEDRTRSARSVGQRLNLLSYRGSSGGQINEILIHDGGGGQANHKILIHDDFRVNASVTVKVLGGISFHVMAENWKHLKDTLAVSSFLVVLESK